MRYQTATLQGPRLDQAVAKALGIDVRVECNMTLPPKPVACWRVIGERKLDFDAGPYSPSTNWAIGGPLLDSERISVVENGASWSAGMEPDGDGAGIAFMRGQAYGPAYLIAAMRALVAAKLGPEVDL